MAFAAAVHGSSSRANSARWNGFGLCVSGAWWTDEHAALRIFVPWALQHKEKEFEKKQRDLCMLNPQLVPVLAMLCLRSAARCTRM